MRLTVYYTQDEAAKAAGVSTRTIQRWVVAGLPATRIGHTVRVAEDDLEAWMRDHRQAPAAAAEGGTA